ncbi:MAG: hypothetical protein LBD13_06035 [Spirochaetaceae bacterium]|jgi:hypothetical protein|nr:hypothetical protein [Spirochaetaceae bacterium]
MEPDTVIIRPGVNRLKQGPALPKPELTSCIAACAAAYLQGAYRSLLGGAPAPQGLADLIRAFASALDFPSADRFGAWFYRLPRLSQQLLFKTAFTDFTPASQLERWAGRPLIIREAPDAPPLKGRLDPGLGIDFLLLSPCCGCLVISLPEYLRRIASFYLEPPPASRLSACLMDEAPPPAGAGALWNRSGQAEECFRLLCKALRARKEAQNKETFLRARPFTKQERGGLRAASGMAPFNREGEPDSVELAARFILGMYNYQIPPSAAREAELKQRVKDFFSSHSRSASSQPADRRFLEYSLCMGYLGKIPYLSGDGLAPASREGFRRIIRYMAEGGQWFCAEKLLEHITVTGGDFSFCGPSYEQGFRVKGECLEIQGGFYLPERGGVFRPEGMMRRYLIFRPLFKAYCYLFAALGVLEIIQKPPELFRVCRGKRLPLSPFEGVSGLRVTEFGRWCLDMIPAPPRAAKGCGAFADRELLLVVIEGDEPECRLYLDAVGTRLGEGRWRISPGSFIAGCTGKEEIQDRIRRFKTLIEPNPAPHWRELFTKALDRAGLFRFRRSDMILYDLPADPALVEELMEDREVRALIRLVEDGMIALAAKDEGRFFALLQEHGVSPPQQPAGR